MYQQPSEMFEGDNILGRYSDPLARNYGYNEDRFFFRKTSGVGNDIFDQKHNVIHLDGGCLLWPYHGHKSKERDDLCKQ